MNTRLSKAHPEPASSKLSTFLVSILVAFTTFLLIVSAHAESERPLVENVELLSRVTQGVSGQHPILLDVLPRQSPPPLEGLIGLNHVARQPKPGDSMAKLLQEFVPVLAERRVWLRSVAKHYPKLVLRPGMTTHFYVAPSRSSPKGQPKQGSLKAIEVELDEDHLLTWEKGPKGIVFGKRERPYDIEIKSVAGTVEGQLSDEGQRLGLSQSLITQLVDVFSWEADFDRVQPGDSFRILYQEKVRKGASTKTKAHILAAELVNAGRQMFAIYFEGRQGTSGYYDLQGRSLARAFLRFPLEFTTISSHFSHARFHPILKIERPHNGVDFVARAGTPVRAVADGKVRFAGWKRGGYGRLITIEHNDGYATRYAHLLKYAAGIKAGVEVKRGQVIGYVGSSGRSTGPHLHFEIYKDGQYMDPLGYESPPEQLLESSLLKIFDNAKQAFLAELASAPHS